MTFESNYGNQPYGRIIKAEFELNGLESMRHAAHLQYKLMLLEPVIRAHIDYPKKSMEIYYLDPKDTELILETIKPTRAILKSREAVAHNKIVADSYHNVTELSQD